MIIIYIITFIFFLFILINYKIQLNFNKKFPEIGVNKFFYFKYLLLLISLFYLMIWLHINEVKDNTSTNKNLFVIDISKSMLVEDINFNWNKISRLQATKNIISNIVSNSDFNWSYSIEVFANKSLWLLPFTNDKDIFKTFLDWINEWKINSQGTNFQEMLKWINNRIFDKSKTNVYIFTDWWDKDDLNTELFQWIYINNLKNLYNNYFVYWIWSEKWWMIFEWIDIFWNNIYKKFNWENLILKLNIENINKMNNILWGKKYTIDNLDNFVLSNSKDKIFRFFSNIDYIDVKWFIFFIIFLLLFLFEEKIYNLIFVKWQKN